MKPSFQATASVHLADPAPFVAALRGDGIDSLAPVPGTAYVL